MAKLGPVQDQSMDEILASIRRMIAEEDGRSVGPQAAGPPIAQANRPAGNVARLFADHDEEPEWMREPADNVVQLAIAQAMEDAEAEVRAAAAAELASPPDREPEPEVPAMPVVASADEPIAPMPSPPMANAFATEPAPAREATPAAVTRSPPPDERRPTKPLLSPRADAVVSSAFNQLATTMLSGSARTIDELVEDLLRPMLRSWLDLNLPPLVERLVREEIERVSRGRR